MIKKIGDVYTSVEAARMAEVSESTIRLAIRNNKLDAIQLNNEQYLIPKNDLLKYMESRNQKKPATTQRL